MLERLRKKSKGKRKLGFTLLEVTISIVISSIIGLATFAIVSSALDTFDRQEQVVDAIEVKEIVLAYTQDTVRTCSNMILRDKWNEDANSIIHDTKRADIKLEGEDDSKAHIIDKKMKETHLLYSDNGRVYKVESNYKGRIDYAADGKYPETTVYQTDASKMTAKAISIFDEAVYSHYNVDIRFKPIFTALQGTYRDIQIIIDVKDRSTDEVLATGSTTFHLLNVENSKREIDFPANKSRALDAPEYNYCYFA